MSPWERFGPPPLGYVPAVGMPELTEEEKAERWIRTVVWWTPAPPPDCMDVMPACVEAVFEYGHDVHAVLTFCRGEMVSP